MLRKYCESLTGVVTAIQRLLVRYSTHWATVQGLTWVKFLFVLTLHISRNCSLNICSSLILLYDSIPQMVLCRLILHLIIKLEINCSSVECSEKIWVTNRNQTCNPLITSQMLYPLSYWVSNGEPSHWLGSYLFPLDVCSVTALSICMIVLYCCIILFLKWFYVDWFCIWL